MKNHYLILLVCMMTLCMAWACSRTDKEPAVSSEEGEVPDQETWNTRIVVSDRGVLRYVIHAGHVQQFEDKQLIRLGEGIRVEFFDTAGKTTSVLTAQEGMVEQQTKNIEAWGDVVIVSGDSLRMEAPKIRWEYSSEKLFAEGEVMVASPNGTERGEGLVFDGRSKTWTMAKVTGRSKEAVKIPERR